MPRRPDRPRCEQALNEPDLQLDCEQGRYAEAEPRFRRLLKLRDDGATYNQWDKALASWAHLLSATGRQEEAARVEKRAVAAK